MIKESKSRKGWMQKLNPAPAETKNHSGFEGFFIM
jgi:hypothetical protein